MLNEKGEDIGYHNGVVFYTLGERHGFTITKKTSKDGAYYVVGKNIKKNILYVSQFPHDKGGLRGVEFESKINLENINWINKIPELNKTYTAQIRYHGEFLPCIIKAKGPERSRMAEVMFTKPILVASRQSCVIYDGNICLGGGVVV